jgi:hypothetical protein
MSVENRDGEDTTVVDEFKVEALKDLITGAFHPRHQQHQ